MNDLRLTFAESIADIAKEEWQVLASAEPYGQYAWLQAIEGSVKEDAQPRYFFLWNDKRLVGAAVGYRYLRNGAVTRPVEMLFGRVATIASKLNLTPNDLLYFGPQVGYGSYVFWNKKLPAGEAGALIESLLEGISQHEEACSCTLLFGRIPEEEELLVNALRIRGYLETQTWPIHYIDIAWKTVDEYVASLTLHGSYIPAKIHGEMSAPDNAGVTIQVMEEFGLHAQDVRHFFENIDPKIPAWEFYPTGSDLIENLADERKSNTVLAVASSVQRAEVVGSALILIAEGSAASLVIGVKSPHESRVACTFFNLRFYAPIKYCIENNIRRLYLGPGTRRVNRKRGCSEMNVTVFLRPTGIVGRLAWLIWFAVHRFWIRRKLRADPE
jgi:predicted N-acyltransferase